MVLIRSNLVQINQRNGGWVMSKSLFNGLFLFVLGFGLLGIAAAAQGDGPKPISEYIEQTAPGTMTFLSYPKYYRNADDVLVPVDTTLRKSSSPDWDYEVTAGIWTLRVRTDGTYQAEHEGDVFTYRLADLGLGRGDGFRSLNLGEPDFSRFSVLGDRIRWADVFPDVDFEVRYINDIMKVDVIVKKNRLDAVKSAAGGEFLTAKFDIPGVSIRSEARQGGKAIDLYAGTLDIDGAPLEIVRDGKVLHKMKPVEIQYLDSKGGAIDTEQTRRVHTAQNWKLNRNAPGAAELSVYLDDVVDSPSGLVIDPTIYFTGDAFYNGGDIYDARIDSSYPNSTYGTSSDLALRGPNSEIRTLVGVTHIDQKVPGNIIQSVTLSLYNYSAVNAAGNEIAYAYKVTQDWYMSSVTWNSSGSSGWSGGSYTNSFKSRPVEMPSSSGAWVTFDITQAFKSHYATDSSDNGDRGFLLKCETTSNAYWYFRSSEYTNLSYRPVVTVCYGITDFGADAGNGNDTANYYIDDRQEHMRDDFLDTIRFFDHTASGGDADVDGDKWELFAETASANEMKTYIVFKANDYIGSSTTTYANRVYDMLVKVDDEIQDGSVIGVELGNEEEGAFWDGSPYPKPDPWYGDYDEGGDYAQFYLAAVKKIRDGFSSYPHWKNLVIIGGGSVHGLESLTWPDGDYGSAGKFIKGFIDSVTQVAQDDGVHRDDYLPSWLAIHAYTDDVNPETGNWGATPFLRTESHHRIDELSAICLERDYYPQFVITEYGFSPDQDNDNPYSPKIDDPDQADRISPNEYTQAVYFIRNLLIFSFGGSYQHDSWSHVNYFQHPKNEPTIDTGFYDQSGGYGLRRKISYVARSIFAATSALELSNPTTRKWIEINTATHSSPIKKAWCGWETDVIINDEPVRWAAFWVYKHDVYYYKPDAPVTASFEINGDFDDDQDGYVYAFYRIDPDLAPNDVFDDITDSNDFNVSYSSGTQKTTIEFDITTENPVFIKITKAPNL
ncbi:MAG: DNRLRE domain-containing protein [bacterium]|nr:DNRLRE domain-containing protein [bacterium]